MTFNRNYAAVPQVPSAPGSGISPLQINKQAVNSAVLPFTQAITAAAETVLQNPAVTTYPAGTPFPLILTIPSKSLVQGQPFDLLVSGDILVGGATPTALFKLYSGTSMTLANDTALAATAASSVLATATPFWFRATMIGSTNSNTIRGKFESLFGATWAGPAVFTGAVPSANFGTDPVANFLFTITPNNANASSYITIYECALNFG